MASPPIFNSNEVRVVEKDGEPWFVAKDVCDILGYSNSRDALAKHVDDEDKNTVAIRDGIAGNPNQIIINESGVYSLILSSKLPAAKQFKRWVTHEVLPSIRKRGMYATPQTVDAWKRGNSFAFLPDFRGLFSFTGTNSINL